MIELAPIVFEPYFKNVIWGGNKICQYKGIAQPEPKIGESWEISAIPGHESVVAEGVYKGLTIIDLIDRFPESLLGAKVIEKYGKKFPLLVKLIDAADNLSVQVHPGDKLAASRHNSLGKSEMWYIIDSDKDAKLYVGLKTRLTPDEYITRVAEGKFAETLAVHNPKPGDVFFVPAGRVHTIGPGNLLAEIQESSDITYRIYDYDRRDANGNQRELHTELAKDAIDYTVCDKYESNHPSDDNKDCVIVSCEHFVTRRILLDGDAAINLNRDAFSVLMCIYGNTKLHYPGGCMTVTKGSTVLIPAAMQELCASGNATLLLSSV